MYAVTVPSVPVLLVVLAGMPTVFTFLDQPLARTGSGVGSGVGVSVGIP